MRTRTLRRHARSIAVATGLLAATLAAAPAAKPKKVPCNGEERWQVKTLQDKDADQLDTTKSKTISIAEVITKVRADAWGVGIDNPRLPDEFDVYKIRGKIIFVKPQKDGDIHIEMSDGQNPEHVIIVEIPDPKCENVKKSDFIGMFRKVKNDWINKFQHPDAHMNKTFEVKGFLFHDSRNHGNGGGPEGVELHPVVSIKKIDS